ncbi:MAG: endolytic transglycosylase MltG [Patescibacteria group bacterium]|jgi:UPF0755 protein
MFKIIKYLFALTVIALISGWVYYTYQINSPLPGNSQEQIFEITQGEGVNQISANLFKQGLIKNSFWFEVYVWQKDLQRNFFAGSYVLPKNLSIKELVKKLTTSGESEKSITIPEGWSNKEIGKYLQDQGLGTQDAWLNLVGRNLGSFTARYDFLADKPATVDLEGYLFPDTYRVFKNSSALEIADKMLANFDKKITLELRQEITRQHKTLFEILTLASIIEKEVSQEEDMKKVADIFYKRLEVGIALQSDATLNYITGKGVTRPSSQDIKTDSLYNTYKYRGLPPGPIANPGLQAIKAAIYPTANPYYYFLTTPTGEVIYSKTHDEHVANKRKYLD